MPCRFARQASHQWNPGKSTSTQTSGRASRKLRSARRARSTKRWILRITRRNHITASCVRSATSAQPSAAMRGPPRPTHSTSGRRARIARTSSAAWWSPEGSPAERNTRIKNSPGHEGPDGVFQFAAAPPRPVRRGRNRGYFAAGAKPLSIVPKTIVTWSSGDAFSTLPLQLGQQKPTSASPMSTGCRASPGRR